MPLTNLQMSFFGLDLNAVLSTLQRLWGDAQRGPLLGWVAASRPVSLLRADGSESVWVGDRSGAVNQSDARPDFAAIEVPEELLLRRPMRVPMMQMSQVADAVGLEMQSVSPFPADDLTWGWRSAATDDGTGLRVEAVLASRKQMQQAVAVAAGRLGLPTSALEVWALSRALPSGALPIVLQGFAESLREGELTRRRGRVYAMLGLAAALLLAIALTPTLQLWLRARNAEAAFSAVQQRTTALVKQREALLQTAEGVKGLSGQVAQAAEPLRVLQLLTLALPDDTYLQTLQISGSKVSATGLTADSAALMTRLGSTPGFKDVRAPQPAMRQPGAAKESFGVEFQFDTQGLPALASRASGAGQGLAPPPAPPAAVVAPTAPVNGNSVSDSRAAPRPAAPVAAVPTAGANGSSPAPSPAEPVPAVPPSTAGNAAPGATAPAPPASPFVIGGRSSTPPPTAPASRPAP